MQNELVKRESAEQIRNRSRLMATVAPTPSGEHMSKYTADDDGDGDASVAISASVVRKQTLHVTRTDEEVVEYLLSELEKPSPFDADGWWWTPVGLFKRCASRYALRFYALRMRVEFLQPSCQNRRIRAFHSHCPSPVIKHPPSSAAHASSCSHSSSPSAAT